MTMTVQKSIQHLQNEINFRKFVRSIDGHWGAVADAKTNAYNGMIGMVQREV